MEFDKNGFERDRRPLRNILFRNSRRDALRLLDFQVTQQIEKVDQLPASLANEGVSQTGRIDDRELIQNQAFVIQKEQII